MTTSSSPEKVLRAQAQQIVTGLKKAARGHAVANDPLGKVAASLKAGEITFGVVMDDKTIKITMPWSQIVESDEEAMIEFIVAQMRGGKLDG